MKVDFNYFVIFHYLGVPFGAIISIKLPRNLFFKIITGSGLIIFSFITLLISNEIWLIPVGYFLAGMAIGLSVSAGFFYIFPVFKNKRYSGRFFNLGVSTIFVLIFLESLLNFILIPFLGVLFFIILFVLVILFLLIGDRKKDSLDTYILENSNIKAFLKNRNNLSVIAFTFILGFFWVNNYYAGVLILDNSGLIDSFGTFIASAFLGALRPIGFKGTSFFFSIIFLTYMFCKDFIYLTLLEYGKLTGVTTVFFQSILLCNT